MRLNKEKPSTGVEDYRKGQDGWDAIKGSVSTLATLTSTGVQQVAADISTLAGYKEDPEAVRKRISDSIPKAPLRKKK